MGEARKRRVLLVEDEPLFAIMIEDALVEAGVEVVAIAIDLRAALQIVEAGRFDAAIIDANLSGLSASPVASALRSHGIPFFVLSGYSATQLPPAFDGAPLVRKPCLLHDVIRMLNDILPDDVQRL